MSKKLSRILNEAESSKDQDCAPCRIAAGIGITKNLCEQYKNQLDCRDLAEMIDNPERYTLAEVQKTIEKIAKNASGRPKELLDYTVCLMKGECSLDEARLA